jgi:phosphohistidine phosphatase
VLFSCREEPWTANQRVWPGKAMAFGELYFVRHGLAGVSRPSRDDRRRPLTGAGVRRTRAVARRLLATGLRFDALLTSPLLRARQTADILCAVGLAPSPEAFPPLAPGGEVELFVRWLRRWKHKPKRRLGLVGHMPDLGAWAEVLLFGEARGRLLLKKAGVLGLALPSSGSPVGRCTLFLLVAPRLLV